MQHHLCSSYLAISQCWVSLSRETVHYYWQGYCLEKFLFYLIRLIIFSYDQWPFNSSTRFPLHMLTLFSVDEILLPRYLNWSTNCSVFPFNMEIVPSYLKHRTLFYLCSHWGQYPLLPAPSYRAEIQKENCQKLHYEFWFLIFPEISHLTISKSTKKALTIFTYLKQKGYVLHISNHL